MRLVYMLLIFQLNSGAKLITHSSTSWFGSSPGSKCTTYNGGQGVCTLISRCPAELRAKLRTNSVSYDEIKCGRNQRGFYDLVCCSQKKNKLLKKGSPCSSGGLTGQCEYIPNCPILKTQLMSGKMAFKDLVRCKPHRYLFCCPKEQDKYIKTEEALKNFDLGVCGIVSGTKETIETINARFVDAPIIPQNASRTFVTGGEHARRERAAYMAYILLKPTERERCGGVLIEDSWILTAAHCLDLDQEEFPFNEMRIILGAYNITSLNEYETYNVSEVVFHPRYSYPVKYHDLALVKLSSKYQSTSQNEVVPICLPWNNDSMNLTGESLILTGYGTEYFNGPTADILLEANVTVFHSNICQKSYLPMDKINFPDGILEQDNLLLCAGGDGKDACNGDSGGPLAFMTKEGRYTLAGIVSTGRGCGGEIPGIYIALNNPNYLKWIRSVVF